MARLNSLTIRNFRSIEGPIRVCFPLDAGVALFGENNTGKSNIVKALNLLLGPSWPSNYDPEDHEFFNRDRNREIVISAQFDPADALGGRYTELIWRFDPRTAEPSYLGWPNAYGRPGGSLSAEMIATRVYASLSRLSATSSTNLATPPSTRS